MTTTTTTTTAKPNNRDGAAVEAAAAAAIDDDDAAAAATMTTDHSLGVTHRRLRRLRITLVPSPSHDAYRICQYSLATILPRGKVTSPHWMATATASPRTGSNDPIVREDTEAASTAVWTRQRITFRPSLAELVSHHQHQAQVDNTGNVCIWDAEKTLAWVLLQTVHGSCHTGRDDTLVLPSPPPPTTVLEVGVGMAGLAGLCLVATTPSIQTLYLTDGHDACVQNNRVHVRLRQAAAAAALATANASSFSTTTAPNNGTIECHKLLWNCSSFDPWTNHRNVVSTMSSSASSSTTTNTTTSTRATGSVVPNHPPPRRQPWLLADWTLVSDCTHFQEYHAALFWTVVQHTRVGGLIWLCQPDRGTSLQRFLTLVQAVNHQESVLAQAENQAEEQSPAIPLVTILPERHYPHIDEIHAQLMRDKENDSNSNNCYDPNIHRPRIFVLQKEREATDRDRLAAIRHMTERDKS